MIYSINGEIVNKEKFEEELEKYIDAYIPYSQYWTPKDKIKEELKEKRIFNFPVYDKRFKNKLVLKTYVTFIALEEEIAEIEGIVAQNEYNPCDDDSLQIAVALYNAGYRKELAICKRALELACENIRDMYCSDYCSHTRDESCKGKCCYEQYYDKENFLNQAKKELEKEK